MAKKRSDATPLKNASRNKRAHMKKIRSEQKPKEVAQSTNPNICKTRKQVYQEAWGNACENDAIFETVKADTPRKSRKSPIFVKFLNQDSKSKEKELVHQKIIELKVFFIFFYFQLQ